MTLQQQLLVSTAALLLELSAAAMHLIGRMCLPVCCCLLHSGGPCTRSPLPSPPLPRRRDPDAFSPEGEACGLPPYRFSRPIPSDPLLSQALQQEAARRLGAENVCSGLNATADSFYSSQGRQARCWLTVLGAVEAARQGLHTAVLLKVWLALVWPPSCSSLLCPFLGLGHSALYSQ